MDLATFTAPQIKQILKLASLDGDVFEALVLVKRMGTDVREGRRRQFNYIGMIVKALIERQDWSSSSSAGSSMKDCILLTACGAHETLPQSAEFPADVFTSCLTTPIKMALK